MFNPEKTERSLLVAVLLLLAVAIFAPPVAQPVHQHAFADPRGWGQIPCALNVLSNLPFALWGAAGLGLLAWQRAMAPPHTLISLAQSRLAALFFAGLLVTAVASGIYHWRPDDAGLVMDRLAAVGRGDDRALIRPKITGIGWIERWVGDQTNARHLAAQG